MADSFDLGNLTGVDVASFDRKRYSKEGDAYLREVVQKDCTDFLCKLAELPVNDDGNITLPAKTMKIPRMNRVPEGKSMTRWEKFAKEKGIKNKKRDRRVWDEVHREWRPRWGYNRANNERELDWVIEANPNAEDPTQDPFEERSGKKRDAMKRQKSRQARNIIEGAGESFPSKRMRTASSTEKKKEDIQHAYNILRKNTASMGKFDAKIPLETGKDLRTKGARSKASAVMGDFKKEKSEMGDIAERILGRKAKGKSTAAPARGNVGRGRR